MPRLITRRRKCLFAGLVLVGLWMFCELLSWAVLSMTLGYSLQNLAQEREGLIGGRVSAGAGEVVHPYTGWCLDPNVVQEENFSGRTIPVNSLGLVDSANSITRRADDILVVGIAGGSVAWQMSVAAERTLVETLEESALLRGRRVQLVRLAVSGYKQPQQLMLLNYLMSLGAEFDVVVNIDGYNEIALALGGNAPRGVAIAYPWAWQTRTMQLRDPRDSSDYAELLQRRGSRQSLARRLQNSWWRYSPFANLIWKYRDNAQQSALRALGFKLFQSTRLDGDRNFAQFGPGNSDDASLPQHVLDLWKRSSVLMHRILDAHDAVYIHVLQPNRHHDAAKIMSVEEQRMLEANRPDGEDALHAMYPQFIRAGDSLRAAGVHFSDQTALFREISDTIYSDAWCHLNTRGSTMLAAAVAREILAALRKKLQDAETR